MDKPYTENPAQLNANIVIKYISSITVVDTGNIIIGAGRIQMAFAAGSLVNWYDIFRNLQCLLILCGCHMGRRKIHISRAIKRSRSSVANLREELSADRMRIWLSSRRAEKRFASLVAWAQMFIVVLTSAWPNKS